MAGASSRKQVRRGFSVVGAGNWGTSLAAAIVAAKLPLVELVTRVATPTIPQLGVMGISESQAAFDAEYIWLCVPDGEIRPVAERIVQRRPNLRGQSVIHSSGALTISSLEAVNRAGGRIAGIAPVQTFPSREVVSVADVFFLVETATKTGARRFVSLVRQLGGRPLTVASEKKALYHAGATLASPLLVILLSAASEALRSAGIERRQAQELLATLAGTTFSNFLQSGEARSFSGVFHRGDAATTELHLKALAEHPLIQELYRALGNYAVRSLSVKNRPRLEQVLNAPAKSTNRKLRVRD